MNKEKIIDCIIEHLQNDAECNVCNIMDWNCNWNLDPVDNEEEEKKQYEQNCKNCRKFLKQKIKSEIKFEKNKIEFTEEGLKFFETFFEDLENWGVV